MTLLIDPPRNLLVSFHYFASEDLDELEGFALIGDSGAFSAKTLGVEITTRQLVAWTQIWEHRLSWVASLDVLYDPEATRRNWNEMLDAGVPGIPTIHVGTDIHEMDYYIERGVDYIGLGGLIGCRYPKAAQLRWLVSAFKYARDNHPQVRFHGWGAGSPSFVRLPFFTFDSSGWASGYMWARVMLRDPRDGSRRELKFDGKHAYDWKMTELLRDVYGCMPSEMSRSHSPTRPQVIRLSALTAAVYEDQIRHMHRRAPVSEPTWGRLPGWNLGPGPHQHLVICKGGPKGGPADHQVLAGLIKGWDLDEICARYGKAPV